MSIDFVAYFSILYLSHALFPFALPLLLSGWDKKKIWFSFCFFSISTFYSYINVFPFDIKYEYSVDESLVSYLLYIVLFLLLERIIAKVILSIPFRNFDYIERKPREFLSMASFVLSEELIFRGVLFHLILRLSDNVPLAVIISAFLYGFNHYYFGILNIWGCTINEK